jgi:DNA-directed RNA polymerase alpha subunit
VARHGPRLNMPPKPDGGAVLSHTCTLQGRPMLDPTPELPDDMPISQVELPARIRNVLAAAGLKTVGEVRETSDEILLSFQDLGKTSIAHLRETLGLPSTDGVRPPRKKAPDLPI